MTLKAYSPEGLPITGTLEVVHGRGNILDLKPAENGKGVDFEWAGDTTIFWDEQRTVEKDGERIFIDYEGNEVPESKIVWREEAE